MEYALILVVTYAAYVLYAIERNQAKLAKDIAELNEKIESLSDKVEDAKQDIQTNLESLADDLTPDDVKVKNLVKMGFDAGDAQEFVTFGTVGGEAPRKK